MCGFCYPEGSHLSKAKEGTAHWRDSIMGHSRPLGLKGEVTHPGILPFKSQGTCVKDANSEPTTF